MRWMCSKHEGCFSIEQDLMTCDPTASIQPRRPVDWYKCKHKTSFQNATDLGAAQRRRLECNVGPRHWCSKALHLIFLYSVKYSTIFQMQYQHHCVSGGTPVLVLSLAALFGKVVVGQDALKPILKRGSNQADRSWPRFVIIIEHWILSVAQTLSTIKQYLVAVAI
jgi:hypothetical protein